MSNKIQQKCQIKFKYDRYKFENINSKTLYNSQNILVINSIKQHQQ